jgi:hypothetical protein
MGARWTDPAPAYWKDDPLSPLRCLRTRATPMTRVRFPKRSKIIWGFTRIAKYVRWYIQTSQFIETNNKDTLIKTLERLLAVLLDAESRAQGRVPFTPSQLKKAKKPFASPRP